MKKNFLLVFYIAIHSIASAQTKSIIFFDSNSTELKTASVKTLDSLINFLKDKSACQIIINGYTDNTGIYEFNQTLSDFRAQNTFSYFKNKNLNAHLIPKGFSSTNPIADNTTEAGKAKNRRVEIIISIPEPTPQVVEKVIESTPIIPLVTDAPKKSETLDDKSKIEDLEVYFQNPLTYSLLHRQ